MAQSPPFSIRLPTELLQRVNEEAKNGLKRTDIIVKALNDHFGLSTPNAPRTAVKPKVDTSMVPVFDRSRWLKPNPKPGAKK